MRRHTTLPPRQPHALLAVVFRSTIRRDLSETRTHTPALNRGIYLSSPATFCSLCERDQLTAATNVRLLRIADGASMALLACACLGTLPALEVEFVTLTPSCKYLSNRRQAHKHWLTCSVFQTPLDRDNDAPSSLPRPSPAPGGGAPAPRRPRGRVDGQSAGPDVIWLDPSHQDPQQPKDAGPWH